MCSYLQTAFVKGKGCLNRIASDISFKRNTKVTECGNKNWQMQTDTIQMYTYTMQDKRVYACMLDVSYRIVPGPNITYDGHMGTQL